MHKDDTAPNVLKVSILGTAGVPAAYGGFETLAENLVRYHAKEKLPHQLTVYCAKGSGKNDYYLTAKLQHIPIRANGIWSIFYDAVSLIIAVLRREHVILLLGVSGAFMLPMIRPFCRSRIITNIDGIEWRRAKWGQLAKAFLKTSERLAIRYSDAVIADNGGISEYVKERYSTDCQVIAYGGDHAVSCEAVPYSGQLPASYSIALCRIEPENNVGMILEAFAKNGRRNIVFIGNWDGSKYGRMIRAKYRNYSNIFLLDPIYDVRILKWIRMRADSYVHGHSAGGTNPALVEMLHFGIPVFAFDCVYNRYTTEQEAIFFSNVTELSLILDDSALFNQVAKDRLIDLAQRYRWDVIGERYFLLFSACQRESRTA